MTIKEIGKGLQRFGMFVILVLIAHHIGAIDSAAKDLFLIGGMFAMLLTWID